MKLKKIYETCGFHCIKINNLGVSFGEQVVLKDVNGSAPKDAVVNV